MRVTISKPSRLSLYIHFPFCIQKCRYCAFASEDRGLDRIDPWTIALTEEIELSSELLRSYDGLYTLYIGGGSPNLLGPRNLETILHKIETIHKLDTVREFTLEINPESVTAEDLQAYRNLGVDRLSIGCQSLQTGELKTLGRIHSVNDFYRTIKLVTQAGFPNLNLDLIFGIPGQTLESWTDTLQKVLQFPANHFSIYALSYEESTPLKRLLDAGKIRTVDDEVQWQMYQLAHETLTEHGFEHYEISNWARPQAHSRHNSAYWEGRDYLGLGPSAHSFIRGRRQWNMAGVDAYLKSLKSQKLPVEGEEKLSPQNRRDEYIMLSLRTKKGIRAEEFELQTGAPFADFADRLEQRMGEGFFREYAYIRDDSLQLTLKGWFLSDYIIGELANILGEKNHDYKKS